MLPRDPNTVKKKTKVHLERKNKSTKSVTVKVDRCMVYGYSLPPAHTQIGTSRPGTEPGQRRCTAWHDSHSNCLRSVFTHFMSLLRGGYKDQNERARDISLREMFYKLFDFLFKKKLGLSILSSWINCQKYTVNQRLLVSANTEFLCDVFFMFANTHLHMTSSRH